MQRVEPDLWQDAVADAVADGFTHFVTLMAIDDGGPQLWLRLRGGDGVDLVLAVDARSPLPSLIGLLPEVDWYEREAQEMFGIRFRTRDAAPLLLAAGAPAGMGKQHLLAARQETAWPGEKDPGGTTPRRRTLPPGVVAGGR